MLQSHNSIPSDIRAGPSSSRSRSSWRRTIRSSEARTSFSSWSGVAPVEGQALDAGHDLAAQPGHLDLEELVDALAEQHQELHPLEEGDVPVGHQVEEPIVEVEVGQLAGEVALFGVRPGAVGRSANGLDTHWATIATRPGGSIRIPARPEEPAGRRVRTGSGGGPEWVSGGPSRKGVRSEHRPHHRSHRGDPPREPQQVRVRPRAARDAPRPAAVLGHVLSSRLRVRARHPGRGRRPPGRPGPPGRADLPRAAWWSAGPSGCSG